MKESQNWIPKTHKVGQKGRKIDRTQISRDHAKKRREEVKLKKSHDNDTPVMNKVKNEKKDEIVMGVWNVRGLNGKEEEMIDSERTKIVVMGLTETKKKGNGCAMRRNGHLMIYGGMTVSERAPAGVAIVVHRNFLYNIKKEVISERLVRVDLMWRHGRKLSVMFGMGLPKMNAMSKRKVSRIICNPQWRR